jgi:hypothetical protein
MSKFTTSAQVNCSQDRFFALYADKAFRTNLYLQGLKYQDFQWIEQVETETEIRRKVKMVPKWEFPGPVAKLFGNSFSLVEDSVFSKMTKTVHWKWTPSTSADKLKLEGDTRIEIRGDSTINISRDFTVEARVFGVGGLIESVMEKILREENNAFLVYMNNHV